jgi:hypothetical protein
MKRCWLHIGMHKTGSTTLQKSLGSVAHPAGWKYLAVGGSFNMGGAMHLMFATNPHENFWLKMRGFTAEEVAAKGINMRSKLAKLIKESSEENLIISGEALCAIDKNGITAIHDFLKPLCDEICVIGYVRDPIEFKVSFFQQRLKVRNIKFQLKNFRSKYRERFEKFDEVFGQENVLLRKFDPASFTNNCIVSDFCEQIGIQGPDWNSVVRLNESLCREACGLLYAYRKFGPAMEAGSDVIKINKQILAPLLAMRGIKFNVSRALLISSLAKETKDIKWMEKRLGVPLMIHNADSGVEVAGEVGSEEDLLRIESSSCVDYANRFRECYGIMIPDQIVPSGSPVEPRQVAEFMEYCQVKCRELRQHKQKSKAIAGARGNWLFSLVPKCWKYIKKLAMITPLF